MHRFSQLIPKIPYLTELAFKACSVEINRHSNRYWNPIKFPYLITAKPATALAKPNSVSVQLSSTKVASLSENVIGKFTFNAPLYVLKLNDRDIVIPVAHSHPSMTHGLAMAQQMLENKTIHVTSNKPLMDVQILISKTDNTPTDIQQVVHHKKEEWLTAWNNDLKQKGRHGSVENITLRVLEESRFVLDITMNTEDSMGAAMVNRLGSEVISQISDELGCHVEAFILSNDVPHRFAEAKVTLSKETLESYGIAQEQLQKDVSLGVLQGVLGATLTTFNDTRAINEAIGIATSSANLLSHTISDNGDVTFTVKLPLPVGSQGRPRMHPGTDALLQNLGNPSSMELATYIACAGLLSGLGEMVNTPFQIPSSQTTPTQIATQQTRIREFSKMSFEQRQATVGWIQPVMQNPLNLFELPLFLIPNVEVDMESSGKSTRIFQHLYGVTEEKTVSLAMAVAVGIIFKNGRLKATIADQGDSVAVEMRLELSDASLGFEDKNGRTWTGQEVIAGIKRIIDWELRDQRRAVTGGKGEQNGGIAIATALGADWVKIMHDFSKKRMQDGTYKPCVTYEDQNGKFILKGTYTFNKAALIQNEEHPIAKEVLAKLNYPDTKTRAVMIASGYMFSRLMALRMLGTFGVDAGHRQVTAK